MMDFRDTKLPPDPAVYRAFMAYAKNTGEGPLENHGIRMAQVIHENIGPDAELISLALLSNLPRETYGIMAKRFGEETSEILIEANLHARTAFAYVEESSRKVKLLATAAAIASIEDFDAALAAMDSEVQGFKNANLRPNNFDEPPFPNEKMCNQVVKAAYGQTGSSTLDLALIEKLEHFQMTANERLIDYACEVPEAPNYPPFPDSKLRQDDKVKDAYYVLTNHSNVDAGDVAKALEAARILSDEPAVNSTAIAAALIDIGILRRSGADTPFLQQRLDWDVMELLENHNVRDAQTLRGMMAAPEEFRQMSLAHAVVAIGGLLESGEKVISSLSLGFIPETMAPMLKLAAVSRLENMVKGADEALTRVRSLSDTPELNAWYDLTIDSAKEFITKYKEKPMLALPAPKAEPKPKPDSGSSFTF